MIRQTLPSISEITESNIVELSSLDILLVIAYIDEDDSESGKLFESIAEMHRHEFLFGKTSDIILAASYSDQLPLIVVHNPLDHIDQVFKNAFRIEDIESFLRSLSTPLVGKFSLETYFQYTQVSYSKNSYLGAT